MTSAKDLPRFKELQEQLKQVESLKFLLPMRKLLGENASKMEETYKQLAEFEKQLNKMISTIDEFNRVFNDLGWVLFENLDLTTAEKALSIAKEKNLEEADQFLINYFSPEWVGKHLVYLKHLQSFRPRFELTQKAQLDYQEGRYYACIYVILAMIDGWVNELNIINHQRVGFFAESSELIAYDSITAYPEGLVKLQKVFSKSRQKTHTEDITIPYRNGILHGMDLGFDNKAVAAKCWAALFCVRDWAIKAERNELDPPPTEPREEKSFMESCISYQKTINEGKQLKEWQPRNINIGKDIPATGSLEEYSSSTPEQKLVEFLQLWEKRNYGKMSACFTPIFSMSPKTVNSNYSPYQLLSWEIEEIKDLTAIASDVDVKVNIQNGDQEKELRYQYRLVCSDQEGNIANIPNNNTSWGLATRTLIK